MEKSSSDGVRSWDALKTEDPDVYAAIEAEEIRQREKLLLIASRKFCQPRGLGRARIRADQQICGRVSRQAILWRMSACRYRRKFGDSAMQRALRRRTCERAAALRITSQHGGLSIGPEGGGHHSWDGPCPRRASHAWEQSQFFRYPLPRLLLWCRSPDRNDRL